MREVEAQAFAYALECGAVPLEQVRAWADREIVSAPSPDQAIVELSLSKAAPDAISLLHVLGEGAESVAVSRRVLSHLHSAVTAQRIAHRQAARTLERLAREGAFPSKQAESEMWRFEDALYLAESEQCGNVHEIKAELEAFLRENAA